MYISVKAFMVD